MRTRTRLAVTLLASAALLAGLAAPASALSPTEQVADINPGAADSFPYDFIVVGDVMYFTADDGTGTELFYTDGSIGSATKLDINPAGASTPADFTLIGTDLYFSADTGNAYGRELLVVSSGGFVGVIADINPGIADSNPTDLTEFNGDLYFTATSAAEGQVLRKYDGSVTTYPTTTLTTAPGDYFEYQGFLYFNAFTGATNNQLFRLDGTNPPTLVTILNPTNFASPQDFAIAGGVLYFTANVAPTTANYQYELWSWNGTTATQLTTGLVTTNDQGGNHGSLQYYTVYNDVLYFAAGTTAIGAEIGSTTGGAVPTFYNVNPGAAGSNVEEITGYKGAVYFGADNGTAGSELYRLAPAGVPTLVSDIAPGPGDSFPYNFTVAGDALVFAAAADTSDWELWSYDGTSSAIQETSINPGATADPYSPTVFNGYVYFNATSAASGAELWRTQIAARAAAPAAALAATGTDPILPIGIAGLLLLGGAVVLLKRRTSTAS